MNIEGQKLARNALLAFAIVLAGLVGPFLMSTGASADGGLLDGVEEGVAELTGTQDQPVEAGAETLVGSTSGASEPTIQTANEATEPLSESIIAASEPVVQTVSEATKPFSESISTIAEPVVESVNPVSEPVVEVAGPLLQTGLHVAAPVIDPLVWSVEPVLKTTVELAQPVVEPVLELTEPILDPILELTEPVLTPIVEPIEPVLDPILEFIEPVAPAPLVELTDPVLNPPLDNEEPAVGLLPVVPAPGLFELIDPIVEGREPLLPIEAITEEPREKAEVRSNLPLLPAVTPATPSGEIDPLQSARSILVAQNAWSSWLIRLGEALRAPNSSDKSPWVHALTPALSGASAGSTTLRNDHPSYRLQGEFRPGYDKESARTPASSSVLLFLDERGSSSAGGGNRIDWPDNGLVALSAALLAIGVLLLLTTTEASPRTWQFRPLTPPA